MTNYTLDEVKDIKSPDTLIRIAKGSKSPEILSYLSHIDEKGLRKAVNKDKQLLEEVSQVEPDPEIIGDIIHQKYRRMRMALGSNENTPSEALSKLAANGLYLYKFETRDTKHHLVEIRSKNPYRQISVKENLKSPISGKRMHVMVESITDPSEYYSLALNKNTSPQTLNYIFKRSKPQYRIDEDPIRKEKEEDWSWMRNPTFGFFRIRKLMPWYKDKTPFSITIAILKNENTPPEAIKHMMSYGINQSTRYKSLIVPWPSGRIFDDFRIAASKAYKAYKSHGKKLEEGYLLYGYSKKPGDDYLSYGYCRIPGDTHKYDGNTPEDDYKYVGRTIGEDYKDMAKIAAVHKNTPGSSLKLLGKNRDPEIRLSIARRDDTPLKTLKKLAKDKDANVAATAKENEMLKKRFFT